MLQLLESQGKEEPVSIRKLDTVEEVLKESDVSIPGVCLKAAVPSITLCCKQTAHLQFTLWLFLPDHKRVHKQLTAVHQYSAHSIGSSLLSLAH